MAAFIIARFDITDPEGAKLAYPRYAEESRPAQAAFGSRYLVRGGTAHPVEGEARARNVVVAFADLAAAVGYHGSAPYQAARRHRLAVATGEMLALEGVAEPGPASDGKKAYWIARFDVRDAGPYGPYVETAKPAFEAHGARFLARGGEVRALEGAARGRNVLIEFPDLERALACWHSDTYQRARAHRLPVSTGEIVIVEGV